MHEAFKLESLPVDKDTKTSGSVGLCNVTHKHKQKCMQLPSQAEAGVYATSLTSTSVSIRSVTHKHKRKYMQRHSQAQAQVYATSFTSRSGSVCSVTHKHKRKCMQHHSQTQAEVYAASFTSTSGVVACQLTRATTHPTAMLLSFVRRFIEHPTRDTRQPPLSTLQQTTQSLARTGDGAAKSFDWRWQ